MTKKLVFIADSSESYINFQKKVVLDEWQANNDDLKIIDSIKNAGGTTLFGGGGVSILNIKDKDTIKDLVKDIKKLEKEDKLDSKISDGLVITTMVPRISTKSLEKLITDLGGEVLATSSKEKANLSQKIIGTLNLNKETKDFIVSYVGNDYESCISLAKSIREIPKEQQRRVTPEDVYLRMPQQEGGIPPWEIEPFIFSGNTTEVIKTFRRIAASAHYLVPVVFLKNKFNLMFKVASILEFNPRANSTFISQKLGVVKNYPLELAIQNSKKIGLTKIRAAFEELVNTETKVKGYSAADSLVESEIMLINITDILNSRKN